jgi:hypothetical protein
MGGFMKIFGILIITAAFVSAWPLQSAYADGGTREGFGAGNGGGVYYCPGQPSEVMLIDLRESERAREVYALLTLGGKGTDELLNDSYRSFPWYQIDLGSFKDEIEFVKGQLNNPANAVSEVERLVYPAEAFPAALPVGCEFRAVVSYQQDQRILYDAQLLARVKEDPVQFAGLLIHEALYRHARDQVGVVNSQDIRPLVPEVLSGSSSSLRDLSREGLLSSGILSANSTGHLWRFSHRDEDEEIRVRISYFAKRGVVNPRCDVEVKLLNRFDSVLDSVPFRVTVHTRTSLDENGLAVSRGPEFHSQDHLSGRDYRRGWGRRAFSWSTDDYLDFYPRISVRDIKQGRYRVEVIQSCSRQGLVGMRVEAYLQQAERGTGLEFSIEENIPNSFKIELR